MKKFFIGIVGLLVITSVVYATSYAQAKDRAYASAVILSAAGYNLKGMKGQYLDSGEYKTYTSYLYSGNEYVVLGAGDNTVRDLDVQIYDNNWNLITSDSDTSNVSTVQFYPPHTGTYIIRTKMYSGHGYFFQMVGWK